MTKFEQFANEVSSTLNGGINDSVTSLSVASATGFPTDGNFRIRINDEILLVTAVSGTTFTVVRGQEGTSAAAHSNGDDVTHVLTKDSLRRAVLDHSPGLLDGKPLHKLTDINGNAVTSASFTWDEQGDSTVEDLSDGGFILKGNATVGTGTNLSVLYKTQPSTPYTFTVGFIPLRHGAGINHCGIVFRKGSDRKFLTLSCAADSGGARHDIAGYEYSTPSTFNTSAFTRTGWPLPMGLMWFQGEHDGSDMIFRWSADGYFFSKVYSDPVGSWITPTQIGIYNSINSATHQTAMTVLHWSEE